MQPMTNTPTPPERARRSDRYRSDAEAAGSQATAMDSYAPYAQPLSHRPASQQAAPQQSAQPGRTGAMYTIPQRAAQPVVTNSPVPRALRRIQNDVEIPQPQVTERHRRSTSPEAAARSAVQQPASAQPRVQAQPKPAAPAQPRTPAPQQPAYPANTSPRAHVQQVGRDGAVPRQAMPQRPPVQVAPPESAMIERSNRQHARRLESPVPAAPVAASTAYDEEEEEQQTGKLPTWMTASIIVCILLLLALGAGNALMRAYITTQENERQAAWQKTVNAHPVQYQALIEQYASEYNLRPAFVTAIILNESSFNTKAESKVGARGLMQLMPDTAEWIAHKLKLDATYNVDQLWEAETNIRFGCWYLNYLSNMFYGDAVTVSSAYHAGQGEITGWLQNSAYAPNGRTLSLNDMPEGPTKIYAGRVTRDYGIYDALYYGSYNSISTGPVPVDGAVTGAGF